VRKTKRIVKLILVSARTDSSTTPPPTSLPTHLGFRRISGLDIDDVSPRLVAVSRGDAVIGMLDINRGIERYDLASS